MLGMLGPAGVDNCQGRDLSVHIEIQAVVDDGGWEAVV